MVYRVILRALKPTAVIVEISLTWWRMQEAGDWGNFFLLLLHYIPSPISLLTSCLLLPIFSGLAPWSLKTSYCKLKYIISTTSCFFLFSSLSLVGFAILPVTHTGKLGVAWVPLTPLLLAINELESPDISISKCVSSLSPALNGLFHLITQLCYFNGS